MVVILWKYEWKQGIFLSFSCEERENHAKKSLGPGVPGKLYFKHFKATRLVAMSSYMLLFGVFVEIINL